MHLFGCYTVSLILYWLSTGWLRWHSRKNKSPAENRGRICSSEASLVVQIVKNLPAMWETWVWSLGWEIPGKRVWQPTPLFLPGEFHGQRSLVGYSPWGCKESDTTEQLTHTHISKEWWQNKASSPAPSTPSYAHSTMKSSTTGWLMVSEPESGRSSWFSSSFNLCEGGKNCTDFITQHSAWRITSMGWGVATLAVAVTICNSEMS